MKIEDVKPGTRVKLFWSTSEKRFISDMDKGFGSTEVIVLGPTYVGWKDGEETPQITCGSPPNAFGCVKAAVWSSCKVHPLDNACPQCGLIHQKVAT
jgi:hypothetical protein